VRIQDNRLSIFRQHSRFLLDEKPICWHEDVWITWHADDGFMLERYSESDEQLTNLPPQIVGENGLEDKEPGSSS
jgi:spermidine/putrescine transport system ATP-binding protein